MSIHDKELEKKLNKLIDKLEKRIDYIGPTPLRRELNTKIIEMRLALRNFSQASYEEGY